jgi:hypothetical protein
MSHRGDPVEREARYVAETLDYGDARQAANRLRQDATQMDPYEFRQLINRTRQLEERNYGSDLEITSQQVRDQCGRIRTETTVGVSGYDQRTGRYQFHPVTSWSDAPQGRCDGGQYYPGRGHDPRYDPRIDPRYDPRYDPRFPRGGWGGPGVVVPLPGDHGRPNGGIVINPNGVGIILNIPGNRRW